MSSDDDPIELVGMEATLSPAMGAAVGAAQPTVSGVGNDGAATTEGADDVFETVGDADARQALHARITPRVRRQRSTPATTSHITPTTSSVHA
jgi:hypothetical protein